MNEEAIKINKELLADVGYDGLTELERIHKRGESGLIRFYRCVECNQENLTNPIIKFYEFDPEKFTCYKCQNELAPLIK